MNAVASTNFDLIGLDCTMFDNFLKNILISSLLPVKYISSQLKTANFQVGDSLRGPYLEGTLLNSSGSEGATELGISVLPIYSLYYLCIPYFMGSQGATWRFPTI